MTTPFIWGNAPRTTNDNTLIDEAIAEAIGSHEADPEAHLGADESLQSHRAAEIIDHRAESVVNDKIKGNARAYVAIVDPTSETDFDTIAAAIEYSQDYGGGNILIMPGEHPLSGDVLLPMNVNLIGVDPDVCIINGYGSGGGRFVLENWRDEQQAVQEFQNLKFVKSSGAIIYRSTLLYNYKRDYIFTNCSFEGSGQWLGVPNGWFYFMRCRLNGNSSGGAIRSDGYMAFDYCTMADDENYDQQIIAGHTMIDSGSVEVRNSEISGNSDGGAGFSIDANTLAVVNIINSYVGDLKNTNVRSSIALCIGSRITMAGTGYISVGAYEARVVGCRIYGTSGNSVRLANVAAPRLVCNNIVTGGITTSGSNHLVANNLVY